jgi:glycosyltransferase involved in cell wall biosynthesis
MVKCLAALPPEERPKVAMFYSGKIALEKFSDLTSLQNVHPVPYPFPAGRIPSRFGPAIAHLSRRILDALGIRTRAAGVGEIDVSFGFAEFPWVSAVHIHWIPDFQHRRLPRFFTPEDIAQRDKNHAQVAGRDGVLLLSSQAAYQDFTEFYPAARVTPRVWSFVSDYTAAELAGPDPRGKYQLPPKYIYLPNQFWAHKDHMTAFRAVKTLMDGGLAVDLVCTGLMNDYRAPGHMQTLLDYIEENGLSARIKILGLVPRQDQVRIFRHACAILQPSLFEGWSTTIEDSKALGKTLILSDLPVHLEQVKGYPFPNTFFETGNADELADTLGRLWPTMAPGPDGQSEQKAREYTAKRKIEAGRLFLSHAREAMRLAGR